MNTAPTLGRSMDQYRQMLFPECKNNADVLDLLSGKRILDLGSGITHHQRYSMLNIVTRETQSKIFMIGVDPRAANSRWSIEGWTFLGTLLAFVEECATDIVRACNGERIPRDVPGKKNVVAAYGHRLPFASETFDMVISSFCVPMHTRKDFLPILDEVHRVTRHGGGVRLFPADDADLQVVQKESKFSPSNARLDRPKKPDIADIAFNLRLMTLIK